MANVIRHKRGTSDPAAGDFSNTGELLINTTDGGLFTKTDSNTVVEIGAGGGGGSDAKYIHTDGTGTQEITTAGVTLDFDTTVLSTGTGDFTVSATGVITIINGGNYFVEYSVDGDQTAGNNRVITECSIQQNGSTVSGSFASAYSRNTADGDYTCVGSALITASANDTISVFATRNDAAVTSTAELAKSGITIFSLSGAGPQGATGATGPQGPTDVPQNAQTSAYTLVASDNGKHVSITTGGVTVPSGVFSAGNIITIYNNSGSNQTITQGSSVTLREAGTANTGNRTLAQRGLATILCVASNEFVVTGTIT